MNYFLIRIVSLALCFLGLVLTYSTSFSIIEAYKSKSWPSVEGKVLKKSLETIKVRNRKRRNKNITYKPTIEYQFDLNGQTYISSRIHGPSEYYVDSAEAQNVLDRFGSNSVKVFYNPDNPQQAYLETGKIRGIHAGLIFSLIFTLLNISFFCFTLFRLKSKALIPPSGN